jgi:phosphoenolpyruvate synthase/pyruvate phosphate dikinase
VANYAAPVYLRKRLKSYVSEKYLADALQILLTPEKPSYNQQSELELFRVVLKSRNQKQLRQNLEKFATRWYWIENSYFISKVLGAGHFYKTVKSFDKRQITAKISEIKKIFVANKRTRRETAKKFGLPKQIQKEARLLAHSIWWQDHRKAKVWWLNSIVDKGSKIAERRYKIRHDDLMYYQSSEWAELLAKGTRFPRKRLQERKVTCVFHTTPKGIYEEIRGSKAQHLIRTFSNRIQQQSGQTDTIAGIPVSKGSGKVRGRVRVLKSTRQAYLMKKGEILVAPMTSPDYVPVMKRAKAVVTDVGGLMSHAAVVSRELGIPCVAGTKTATKILKSGDLVEVDANSGTVRKISHAKKHSRN